MSNRTVLADECKVECVDGSIVENVRIFLEGEDLVYVDSSNNTISGRIFLGGRIAGGVEVLQLIKMKEV